ncbi:nuclear transport factor 2 family protein [Streptomyces sp. NPDC088812]|uniref:nuclear transport factor 2 family protein n=1 Tax=Streptomyces sp. NPDC088812 TaxID=3365905 RepID=UPI0038065320
MPPKTPPTTPADQLRWLVDRAAISDLLIDFARALDDKDWEGYAANYAEDGVLAISPTVAHTGRAGLAEFVAGSLGRYAGTHHLSTNHAIAIDGDEATTRSYLVAAHVLDASDPSRHADGAGWYRCRLRRTPQGWRFTHVALEIVHVSGEPIAH